MGALSDIPLDLLAGWSAWIATGLALAWWVRRKQAAEAAEREKARQAAIVRPSPKSAIRTAPLKAAVGGFDELQAMLDSAPPLEHFPSE